MFAVLEDTIVTNMSILLNISDIHVHVCTLLTTV